MVWLGLLTMACALVCLHCAPSLLSCPAFSPRPLAGGGLCVTSQGRLRWRHAAPGFPVRSWVSASSMHMLLQRCLLSDRELRAVSTHMAHLWSCRGALHASREAGGKGRRPAAVRGGGLAVAYERTGLTSTGTLHDGEGHEAFSLGDIASMDAGHCAA